MNKALQGFLNSFDKGSKANPHIDPEYLEKNVEPFIFLNYYLHSAVPAKVWRDIRLNTFLTLDKNSYLIKLSFFERQKEAVSLSSIYTLIAKEKNDTIYFYNALQHYTRNWKTEQVGSIKYIHSTYLNRGEANRMDSANIAMANKFQTPVINITYYKFEDPEQLFKTIGYDYIPNMYYSRSGGLAENWTNTLLAGNNAEYYAHEAFHLYSNALFPDRLNIIDEGYATFVGGSGGKSLNDLAPLVVQYLNTHPNHSVEELLSDFSVRVGADNVPICYIISGLICKDVETRFGLDGIKTMFDKANGRSYYQILAKATNIKLDKIESYVKRLITTSSQ